MVLATLRKVYGPEERKRIDQLLEEAELERQFKPRPRRGSA